MTTENQEIPTQSIASTRVQSVPSAATIKIAKLVLTWSLQSAFLSNPMISNKDENELIGKDEDVLNDRRQRGINCVIKVVDGEPILQSYCSLSATDDGISRDEYDEDDCGTNSTSVSVPVSMVLKELPGHLIGLALAATQSDSKKFLRQCVVERTNDQREQEQNNDREIEIDFGVYVSNALDVMKRVVTVRSLPRVKSYFDRVGWDPVPRCLDAVGAVLRRVALCGVGAGKDDFFGKSLELRCELINACTDVVIAMWDGNRTKAAAICATYPLREENIAMCNYESYNEVNKRNGEGTLLMAFYDAAYVATRLLHEALEQKSDVDDLRAFLETFASFAFDKEIVEYAHKSGGRAETMRMVRLALALLQFTPQNNNDKNNNASITALNSSHNDAQMWTRLWYSAKGAQCLRAILTAELDSSTGETLYDKYLESATKENAESESVVARDSLKLATECAANAFVHALSVIYPNYVEDKEAVFALSGVNDTRQWRTFATLARGCEILCEDSEVRDVVISTMIGSLASFMNNIARGRINNVNNGGSEQLKAESTFSALFVENNATKLTEAVKVAWLFIYGTIASSQAAPFLVIESSKKASFGEELNQVFGAKFGKDASHEVSKMFQELHDSAKGLAGAENAQLFESFLKDFSTV